MTLDEDLAKFLEVVRPIHLLQLFAPGSVPARLLVKSLPLIRFWQAVRGGQGDGHGLRLVSESFIPPSRTSVHDRFMSRLRAVRHFYDSLRVAGLFCSLTIWLW